MSSSPHVPYAGTRESNGVIQALLTDLYQITMAYAYWKSGKMNDKAVFDLYFRRNPFKGEFTLFAGLEECVKLLQNFSFSRSDVEYLKKVMPPTVENEFFQYLSEMTANEVTLWAVDEGTVVFPKVPLLIVEGPLAVVQLLETPLLNLINYASLVATNAMRFRIAAGPGKTLLEFGLRRAQGPDGGLSASRYCYMGGFDGTSNVLAGKMFGIPVRGTHAHAFVTSYNDLSEVKTRVLKRKDNSEEVDFVDLCLKWQKKLSAVMSFLTDQVSEGELVAFISYAQAFPDALLALIDTYDVIRSGLPNFCTVAMALYELGYQAKGVRLDSGDLAYLSFEVRKSWKLVAQKFDVPWFEKLTIVASNDINEDTIHSLNTQGHDIDSFGIGTHLVTCQKQPALGCVFKLVEVNGRPTMKLSEDVEKITIPGRKRAYRLYGHDGTALVDLLVQESKRAYVSPATIELLHQQYWKCGKVMRDLPNLEALRTRALHSMQTIRQDHKRALNPTPYKVSVSANLYTFIHDLWLQNAPIGELS
ncbi:hypothetical protein BaRGS_00036549 [Batillaria attramentaria]|uniref:Nicotinate phosphoribosyltransferase n=1 Tax=Batillaria attramentaria TaxID=370345 RepID=A0ABD0JBK2_9CAEN